MQSPVAAGAISSRVQIPEPLSDALDWLLAALNDRGSSLTAADVTDRIAPDFLAAVPAEQIVGIVQQFAAAFAPVSLDGFTRPPTATQVNALLTTAIGVPLVIPISIEDAPPHRMTGVNFAPAPPPSGVQLEPTVDPDGTQVVTSGRQDGVVDVNGRAFYRSALGTDGPTVVLESGANDPAAPWFAIENAVASFARVFSYDRANTAGSASDPAPRPRTGEEIVPELHALLAAADEPGPYVFVGHSIGGVFIRMYASMYPEDVAGMVLIDSSHEEQNARVQELLSPEQWAAYMQMNIVIEGLDLDASFAQLTELEQSSPLRPMPLFVVSAGQADDPAAMPPDWPTEAQHALWMELQEDLAGLVPGARHVVAEESRHYVHQSQPDLVVDAIRQVVDAVREPTSWATPPVATPVT
jgi:pimeloyl-ACP methyl ester carboxylesterase